MSMPVQEKEALAAAAVVLSPLVAALGITLGLAVERWMQRRNRGPADTIIGRASALRALMG